MPLDAFHLFVITKELNARMQSGRIDKVTMPSPTDVLLHIRANGANEKLLISADPAKPRLWITPLEYVNPAAAPAFCMHLRKYIQGGRILGVRGTPTERVVQIDIISHSELGDERMFCLTVEIMGRYSNILLVNEQSMITDCLKHTPFGTESARPVLPNLPYVPAAVTDKFDFTDSEKLRGLIAEYKGGDIAAHLLTKLAGFAAFTLRLITADMTLSVPPTRDETERTVRAIKDAYLSIETGGYTPRVVERNGMPAEFTVLPSEGRAVGSLMEAQQAYFSQVDSDALWKNAVAVPTQTLNGAIKKLRKRITGLDEKIAESQNAETLRVTGEILTANLYRIPPRAAAIDAENWYDGSTVTIKLDPAKTGVENANLYFKRYAKLKRAADVAAALKADAAQELDMLESVLTSLSTCETYDDVEGVKEELTRLGLLKRPVTKRRPQPIKSKPLTVKFEGYEIYVGKNNLQNEELTFHVARGNDVWAHVLRAHGSHVIVKNQNNGEIPQSVILRACELAAYYSASRNSDKVDVDWCLKKFVTRNSGKGIANVHYTHQQTLTVKPKA